VDRLLVVEYGPLPAFGSGLRRQHNSVRMPAKTRMTSHQFKSFADFWPYYLGEHSKPATRVLHCVGSFAAIAFVVWLIAIGKWWLFPLGLVPGYAFAWAAHFFIEKNRPATFIHPLWSFMGDWKMLGLMLTGRLR
jgi:hypothetical protein